ncbi:MAG TPA: glycosyltransferase 87 family protein [Actinomycetota bacterium]|nr:glycosyltransferase 87 family protein [Actinomycetota bacterium]
MIRTEERLSPRPARPPSLDLALALAVFAGALVSLLHLRIHPVRFPLDLDVYREAGRYALHGRDPYSPGFGDSLRIKLPFTYPPFAALVFAPLALLPRSALLVGWTALCIGLFAVIVHVAVRPALLARGWSHPVVLAAAAAILVWSVPVAQTISYGQINLVLVAACLLDCGVTPRASGRRRSLSGALRGASGVLVGIATAIKLTPGIFIVYFALTRQWAAAARAAVTAAACAALAFVVAPGPSREFWLHLVFDDRRPGSPAYYGNQSLLGALERLHLAWLWVPLGLALGCVGLWRATRAHRAGAEVTAVALVGLTAVVVSPISWQHHAVWIVPAAAALIAWATTPKRAAVAILAVAVFLFPLDFWGQRLSSLGGSPLIAEVLRNSYALAFIALLLLLPLPSPSPPSSPPSPPKDAAPPGRRRLAWR